MHRIQHEKNRISAFSRTIPGKPVDPKRRLNVIKVTFQDYTTQATINQILESYSKLIAGNKNRILICCHGRRHPAHQYLPVKEALMLDINPACVPDILGDLRNYHFMKKIPKNYFSNIYLTYCPPPYPMHSRNICIWKNLCRILKPGGCLISNYIWGMYFRKLKKYSREQINQRITSDFKPFFDRIRISRGFTYMYLRG